MKKGSIGKKDQTLYCLPVEQGLVPVLHGLEDLPLPDVVRADAGLDDLVLGLLLGAGRPALVVLLHDDLLLVLDVQAGKRSRVDID